VISIPNRHCAVELQALPSRIGQVRRIVTAHLRYWQLDPLIDRAALGVTELLANVHRHARPDKTCVVELELLLGQLTVSVRDRDPRLPVLTAPDDLDSIDTLATCGRGLAMVAAVSESWGARPEGEDGKVVWFTLAAPGAGDLPWDVMCDVPPPCGLTAPADTQPAHATPTHAPPAHPSPALATPSSWAAGAQPPVPRAPARL